VPVLDGSILQLNFSERRAARPEYWLGVSALMTILRATDFIGIPAA
jgi:hypothetical protein